MNNILIRSGLWFGFAASLTVVSPRAFGLTKYFLDVDGTTFDDQSARSTWGRMWHLKLVETPRNVLQPDPRGLALPEIFPVTFREYKRLRPHLARGPAELNRLDPMPLDVDPIYPDRPRTIIPGYYYASPDVTFIEYRPGRDGTSSYLVDRQEEAIVRARKMNAELAETLGRPPTADEAFRWQGPAMDLIRHAMSRPKTVDRIYFRTAGDHQPWEWQALFNIWKREGVIKHAFGKNGFGERTVPHVKSISDWDAMLLGRRFDVRKGNELRMMAEALANSSADQHAELSPDEREAARGIERTGHTLIVAEDDPNMLTDLRQHLMALSGEIQITNRVKFVLLNARVAGDPVDPLFPYEWTVFHRRLQRPATAAEIALWTGRKTCEGLLN